MVIKENVRKKMENHPNLKNSIHFKNNSYQNKNKNTKKDKMAINKNKNKNKNNLIKYCSEVSVEELLSEKYFNQATNCEDKEGKGNEETYSNEVSCPIVEISSDFKLYKTERENHILKKQQNITQIPVIESDKKQQDINFNYSEGTYSQINEIFKSDNDIIHNSEELHNSFDFSNIIIKPINFPSINPKFRKFPLIQSTSGEAKITTKFIDKEDKENIQRNLNKSPFNTKIKYINSCLEEFDSTFNQNQDLLNSLQRSESLAKRNQMYFNIKNCNKKN